MTLNSSLRRLQSKQTYAWKVAEGLYPLNLRGKYDLLTQASRNAVPHSYYRIIQLIYFIQGVFMTILQNRKANATSATSTSTSMLVSPPSPHSSPSISTANSPSPATPHVRGNLYPPASSSRSLTPTSPLSSFSWSHSPCSPSPPPSNQSADADVPDPAPNRLITRAQAKKLNFPS